MTHPDGTIWRAAFKHDGRIVQGCIERFMGKYFCSVDGAPHGHADDLVSVQLDVLHNYKCPVAAWRREDTGP